MASTHSKLTWQDLLYTYHQTILWLCSDVLFLLWQRRRLKFCLLWLQMWVFSQLGPFLLHLMSMLILRSIFNCGDEQFVLMLKRMCELEFLWVNNVIKYWHFALTCAQKWKDFSTLPCRKVLIWTWYLLVWISKWDLKWPVSISQNLSRRWNDWERERDRHSAQDFEKVREKAPRKLKVRAL